MSKIIALFFLQVFILLDLHAKEPTLGILQNVYTNSIQQFSLENTNFYCQAYGVVSLEEIFNSKERSDECKEAIQKIYIQDPSLKYFSARLLKKKQRYHVEFREQRCILYAKGQYTLSELLLKNGLALMKENFADKEFLYSFHKAQRTAQRQKKGIWSNSIVVECISSLDQEEER